MLMLILLLWPSLLLPLVPTELLLVTTLLQCRTLFTHIRVQEILYPMTHSHSLRYLFKVTSCKAAVKKPIHACSSIGTPELDPQQILVYLHLKIGFAPKDYKTPSIKWQTKTQIQQSTLPLHDMFFYLVALMSPSPHSSVGMDGMQ